MGSGPAGARLGQACPGGAVGEPRPLARRPGLRRAGRVESSATAGPTSDFSHLVGFFPCHVFKYVDLIRLTKASLDAKFLTDFYD